MESTVTEVEVKVKLTHPRHGYGEATVLVSGEIWLDPIARDVMLDAIDCKVEEAIAKLEAGSTA